MCVCTVSPAASKKRDVSEQEDGKRDDTRDGRRQPRGDGGGRKRREREREREEFTALL